LTANEYCSLLHTLIVSTPIQTLWQVSDRGVPVFAHSIDVALLALDGYPDAREKFPGFRLDAVLLGAILHDLTKASARHGSGQSHSHIMNNNPSIAVAEAMTVLDDVQNRVGVWLDHDGIEHLWHAIASHHGRWGMISPRTPEAWLLHECDNYSASHHRIAPIDANDILPLTGAGYTWTQIGERLGVNRSVVKTRLVEACRVEGVRTPTELLERWRERGIVGIGDADRARQIERARHVVEFARRCPDALIDKVREVLPESPSVTSTLGGAVSGPLIAYPDRSTTGS
jgi:hypothetical protein